MGGGGTKVHAARLCARALPPPTPAFRHFFFFHSFRHFWLFVFYSWFFFPECQAIFFHFLRRFAYAGSTERCARGSRYSLYLLY